jgi:hypothetical protein
MPDATAPDGGFFAAPIPTQVGYGPPPTPTAPSPSLPESTPALVIAAVTSLGMAAIAATWLGLSMLSIVSTVGTGNAPGLAGRGAFLVINGLVDVWLSYLLLRGVDAARWGVSFVCAWWLAYWLYQDTRATHALSQVGLALDGTSFGGLAVMATLGLLLLAGWAGATAGVLWTSPSSRHFARPGRQL